MILDSYMRRDSSREINIAEVRLLIDATVIEICMLHAGADEIRSLNSSQLFKSLLMAIRDEVAPRAALRKIPSVAIAKVLSLRISRGDKFHLARFGPALWRNNYCGV